MTVLQRTDLTTSQKIQCAAAAVAGQHAHGSKTALSETYEISRPTVYAVGAAAESVLRSHFESPLLQGAAVDVRVDDAQLRPASSADRPESARRERRRGGGHRRRDAVRDERHCRRARLDRGRRTRDAGNSGTRMAGDAGGAILNMVRPTGRRATILLLPIVHPTAADQSTRSAHESVGQMLQDRRPRW